MIGSEHRFDHCQRPVRGREPLLCIPALAQRGAEILNDARAAHALALAELDQALLELSEDLRCFSRMLCPQSDNALCVDDPKR